MKKIGFVDYYISEWHANNYPAWMAEACEKLGVEYEVAYVWAETDVSPVDGVTTAQWCEKFGAQACGTLEELCEKSDVIVILAPGFPEKHLPYAETVLRYGKRTYIDKTFAPDAETAQKIFALGEKYGAPMFSSSALRYAAELELCPDCRAIMTTGSGRSADEYLVHQAEMVVKKLGIGAEAVSADCIGGQTSFRVYYPDDRAAVMNFAVSNMPFTVHMMADGKPGVWKTAANGFFQALIADMIRFFEEGTLSFPNEETLEVMRIRAAALRAAETPGVRVAI